MSFHSTAMVKKVIPTKTVKCSSSYSTGTFFGHTVQKILNGHKERLQKLQTLSSLKIWFLRSFCSIWRKEEFSYRASGNKRYALRAHSHHLLHGKIAVSNRAEVDSGVWNRPNQLDATV